MGKPRNLGEQVKQLRDQGVGFNEIVKRLKCSKSTVHYHISDDAKKRVADQTKKYRLSRCFGRRVANFQKIRNQYKELKRKSTIQKAFYTKIRDFCRLHQRGKANMSFSEADVLEKIGPNPKCYLTGESIDLSKSKTYHFDHIIPRSRGGDNSLNNLGLCTKRANLAKSDMTLDELYELCEKILKNKR